LVLIELRKILWGNEIGCHDTEGFELTEVDRPVLLNDDLPGLDDRIVSAADSEKRRREENNKG
jgi:hypothetical protein